MIWSMHLCCHGIFVIKINGENVPLKKNNPLSSLLSLCSPLHPLLLQHTNPLDTFATLRYHLAAVKGQ